MKIHTESSRTTFIACSEDEHETIRLALIKLASKAYAGDGSITEHTRACTARGLLHDMSHREDR